MEKMTKERLAQYIRLKQEIAMLEEQIRDAITGEDIVVDHVNDYSSGQPHPIVLRGFGSKDIPRLTARRTWCRAECKKIEEFIYSLGDSTQRQIFTRRYLEGNEIQVTARIIGLSERQVNRIIAGVFKKSS